MKVIDAVWEKRNLGCDTAEIRCSFDDGMLDEEYINMLTQPYQVMRIPSGRADLLLQAQKMGFNVIEGQVHIQKKLKDFSVPEMYQRFVKDVSYSIASDKEIEDILHRIEKGDMFTTDRIALDPHFSKEIAGRRYVNWTRDLLKSGYILYIKWCKERAFGWNINNSSICKNATGTLGGNFQEKAWAGAGIAGIYLNLKVAQINGAESFESSISTNNVRNIRLHLSYGFTVSEIEYVAVRHLKKE